MNQMYVPPLSQINKRILMVYVGTFVVTTIFKLGMGINLLPVLGLSSIGIQKGFIFQVLTFPFIETQMLSVVFNALLIWFIGSDLESRWGTRFYLKFLALTTYLPGLVYLCLSFYNKGLFQIFNGMSGTNLALLVAYAMVFSERILVFMFIFPMKAKYFCMLLAAIEVYMTLSYKMSSLIHCLSMALAFFYFRYASFIARGGSFGQLRQKREKEKMRSKLRLVKDEDEGAQNKGPNPDEPKYWQ